MESRPPYSTYRILIGGVGRRFVGAQFNFNFPTKIDLNLEDLKKRPTVISLDEKKKSLAAQLKAL